MTCTHIPRFQYPIEEAMPGPGAFCDSCRRWVSTARPKPISGQFSPLCGDSAKHFKTLDGAANYREHNHVPGLITECACGGYTLVAPASAKPKLDLERAQRSCFSKKGYGLELANDLAVRRGLRVYACDLCGRYHLTKQPLQSAQCMAK